MFFLCLPSLLGLVMADNDPRDLTRLCSSGECPAGWKKVEAGCILFAGWEEVSAREVCREEMAEYSEWVMMREESDTATRHSLPVCLVRRETQCQCGQANRGSKIVGGVKVERNEYPWQVRLAVPGCGEACCGGSLLSRDKILTAAHCTQGQPAQNITVWTRDHDWTKVDGEVNHAVCSKTEHPEYDRKARHDQDIAVLHLCQPLMFTDGKFSKYFSLKSD